MIDFEEFMAMMRGRWALRTEDLLRQWPPRWWTDLKHVAGSRYPGFGFRPLIYLPFKEALRNTANELL